MKTISVSAPGKIHLLGEHAVVYGKPAILAATDKRCFVSITKRRDKTISVQSNETTKPHAIGADEIESLYETNQKKWESFVRTNETSILASLTKTAWSYPFIIISEALHFYNPVKLCGFDMIINSQVGRGMGSSAALAVSVSAAVTAFLGKPWDLDAINTISFTAEQKIHGFPSGGDNTASCFGGFIFFQIHKPKNEMRCLSFPLPKKFMDTLFLIDTGKPTETTGDMVAFVRNMLGKSKESKVRVEEIFTRQEQLAYQLLEALADGNTTEVAKVVREGEKNLELLGVVGQAVIKMLRELESIGVSCKVCGAGGRIKQSGIVLGLGGDKKKAIAICRKYSYQLSSITLGTEGVRLE